MGREKIATGNDLVADQRISWSLIGLILILGATLFSRYVDPPLLAPLNPWPDSVEYVVGARNIIEHGRFSIIINGQEMPPRYSLGFPLLITPVYAALGTRYTNAFYLILFLDLALVIMTYVIARRVFGQLAAVVAAYVISVSPADQRISQFIMSDVPSTAFIVGAIALLIGLRGKFTASSVSAWTWDAWRERTLLVGASAVLGYACWIRQINAALFPAFAIFIFLTYYRSSHTWRENISAASAPLGLFISVFALTHAPILLYNLLTFGGVAKTGYDYWLPTWYSDFGNVFSLGYIFGPRPHGPAPVLLEYLQALIGIPLARPDEFGIRALYPALIAPMAILGSIGGLTSARQFINDRDNRIRHRVLPAGLRLGRLPIQSRYVVFTLMLVTITLGIYCAYFYYALRFVHVFIPSVAILAGGGITIVNNWIHIIIRRLCLSSAILLAPILVFIYFAGLTLRQSITDGLWWRTTFINQNPIAEDAFANMLLISKYTENDAVIISNYEPAFFGAYQAESDREIMPLSIDRYIPEFGTLPAFESRPDVARSLIQSGRRVYSIESLSEALPLIRTEKLKTVLVHQEKISGVDVSLYRLTLDNPR